MKFSKLYAPTTKEAPKDATLPSHQYLVRGGFISQVGSGLYNFLPMGKIVFDKIKDIVKDEMDKTGAQEVQMDIEGMQVMRILGKNMAYFLKCKKLATEMGLKLPQQEKVNFTNFIR